MADCAAGLGWLSFAYLLYGGKQAILIEPDRQRIIAAKEIAGILGLYDRCCFENALLENVRLLDNSVDVFCSIETLEHVGGHNVCACIENIARVARQMVLLTTPNKLFPVIAHDTRLPFAHWLPSRLLQHYAKAFGRLDKEQGNYFLAPWHLGPLRRKFHSNASYQTFSSIDEFDGFYPHYLPYGRDTPGRYRTMPSGAKRVFVKWAGKFLGSNAYMISPNLSTVWTTTTRPAESSGSQLGSVWH
ncbi:methyltransferase family protein [Thiogranum longum]|uniref:Methyltransferase family protein n=1 Tax=Thiogranum longum TaxID=1537524 RepID=A0A4R1HLT5_9GAMM|nr:methyltransferase family protein [Thiogranum longum]